jgi:hypothetical protein
MKSAACLLLLAPLLVGCGTTAWEDTGEEGPWCAAGRRARVLSRNVNPVGAPNPHSQLAFEDSLGMKKDGLSFWHELDEYFSRCAFIQPWPARGTIGSPSGDSVTQHESPFDFYLVSMDPTVIVGVDRQPPKPIPPEFPKRKWDVFVGSKYLVGFIAVRTKIPYRPGFQVVWFSPAADHQLHKLDLKSGTASFMVGQKARITAGVEGDAQLVTSRK